MGKKIIKKVRSKIISSKNNKGGQKSIDVILSDSNDPLDDAKAIELKLTYNEKLFCEKYVELWDYEKAFLAAGYKGGTPESIRVSTIKLRQRSNVWAYLKHLQRDTEKIVGINRKDILKMHRDIIDTSIGHMHKKWTEREEFEKLTPEQKLCIQAIDHKSVTKKGKTTHYVKVTLYDRQKSMDAITKLMGYDEPDRLEISGNKELIQGMFPFGRPDTK